jgi:ketosteroid isomerase-like protein
MFRGVEMDVKNITRIAASVFVVIISLIVGFPADSSGVEPEETKVIEAIRLMYVALQNDDLAKFEDITSADFFAFDVGKRFSRDELMALIKNAHAAGKIYKWTVTEPEVHIDGNTAWITYVNRGSLEDNSGKKNLTWLESAVLRRHNGAWRIQFLHSTRVPAE